MRWELYQYHRVVDELLESIQKENFVELEAELLSRLSTLQREGNLAKRPVSAPLQDGIFELRAKDSNWQVRLLYYFDAKHRGRIVFASTVEAKKTRATSKHDIELAKARRTEIEAGRQTATFVDQGDGHVH